MTPYNAAEERMQAVERRVTDLEDEHHACPGCTAVYGSASAAEACCDG